MRSGDLIPEVEPKKNDFNECYPGPYPKTFKFMQQNRDAYLLTLIENDANDENLYRFMRSMYGSQQLISTPEIFNHIESCTKKFLTEDLINKLFDKGCWCAPLKSHREVYEDPQVKHMKMFSSFNHEKYGEVTTVSPPVKMSETPA